MNYIRYIFTLFPYNYYILLAGYTLLVIFLIVFLVHLFRLFKTFGNMKPTMEKIQYNAKMIEIKTSVLQDNQKAKEAQNKKYAWIVPLVLGIYENYKNDQSETKTVKKVTKAVSKTFQMNSQNKKLAKTIKQAMG